MRKNLRFWLAILVPVAAASPSAADVETHALSVRQHPAIASPLTTQAAKTVLATMTSFLGSQCDVAFALFGVVEAHTGTALPFSINSSSDLTKYAGLPGSVDIVGEINWCSGIAPGVIGCANTPGRSLTVVRYTPSMEPMLWAHEFAHTTGSRHRDVPGALMKPTLGPTSRTVDAAECVKLIAGSPAVHSGVEAADFPDGPPMSAGEDVSPAGLQGPPEPVLDFIQHGFPHGTPFALASRYGEGDVDALRAVLGDPSQAQTWRTAVATLGAIGGERAKAALLDFLLTDPTATRAAEEYIAKSSVPIALGWTARVAVEAGSDDRSALDLLIKMTNDDWWVNEAGIAWTTPIHGTRDALLQSLIIKGFMGLALTGTPEADVRIKEAFSQTVEGAPEPVLTPDETTAVQNLGIDSRMALERVPTNTRTAILNGGGAAFLENLADEAERVRTQNLVGYYQ
jgi:hypothetical protein